MVLAAADRWPTKVLVDTKWEVPGGGKTSKHSRLDSRLVRPREALSDVADTAYCLALTKNSRVYLLEPDYNNQLPHPSPPIGPQFHQSGDKVRRSWGKFAGINSANDPCMSMLEAASKLPVPRIARVKVSTGPRLARLS